MEALHNEEWPKAEKLLALALESDPNNRAALRLRSLCAIQMDRLDIAEACLCRIACLNPSSSIFMELGCFYEKQGVIPKAIACLERAVDLGLRSTAIYAMLGMLLRKDHPRRSEYFYEKLAEQDPKHAALSWENARKLGDSGEHLEAYAIMEKLSKTQKENVAVIFNMAYHQYAAGQHEEGLTLAQKGYEILTKKGMEPDFNFTYNIESSRYSLKKHDFAVPQCEIECEKKRRKERPYLCRGELWDGKSDISGKHLVIYGDQGLGDNIHFVRFIPLLRDHGCASITLRVPHPLIGIFDYYLNHLDGSVKVNVFPMMLPLESYPGDFYISLLNLPYRMGIRRDQVTGRDGYFQAEPALVEQKRTLFTDGSYRVGIKWQGNPNQGNDQRRSFSFYEFLRLREVPDIQLYSLHYDPADKWLDTICESEGVTNLAPHMHCFRHTSALIEHLDLVITVDTGVAHLCGALAKPTWVVTPYNACWRYPLKGEQSDWYNSQRIFRQGYGESWSSVMQRVIEALHKHMAEQSLASANLP